MLPPDHSRQEAPCIRCGDCDRACPVHLKAQQLLRQLGDDDLEQAGRDGLLACTECGRCDEVCPSHIPLTSLFHHGKLDLALSVIRAERADAARLRYEARGRRLQREADERAQLELLRKQALAAPDAIAASLARARARREANKAGKPE